MENFNEHGKLPQLMTQREVAAFLGVSNRTVASYKAKGVIPFVQRNRWLRFRYKDVMAFIDSHYVKPNDAEQWKN